MVQVPLNEIKQRDKLDEGAQERDLKLQATELETGVDRGSGQGGRSGPRVSSIFSSAVYVANVVLTFAKARKSIGGKESKGKKNATEGDVYADGGFQLLRIRDHGYLCLLELG